MIKPTLSEFFDATFVPLWIHGKRLDHKTESSYRESMAHWLTLTENPTIDQITDLTVANFVAELCKQPGKKAEHFATSSVAKHCRQVDTVLKMTGPRSRHNRKGQGLLTVEPPFIEIPRADNEPPNGDWTIDEIRAMYLAADAMRHPQVEDVSPADWWRTYITLAYYTGLRIFATTNVEYGHVNGQWLTAPAKLSKGRKGKRQYLHKEALEHIERIRRLGRDKIIPWPKWDTCKRYSYTRLHQLQAAAGLPKSRWFGFQSFRKTHATIISSLSLERDEGIKIAQQSAGHSSSRITTGHYINGSVQERMVAAAIDRMPSPCAEKPVPQSVIAERTVPRERVSELEWM